jgi:phosphopantetheinyl transferase (holo-ACP synthase)
MKSFNDLRVLVDRKKKTNISISNELKEKMQKQRQKNGSVTKSTVNHDA